MGFFNPALETCPRPALQALQARRLARLLTDVPEHNPFYRSKLRAAGLGSPATLARLCRDPRGVQALPFTTKAELLDDQAKHPPWGTNLSVPPEALVRQHQTSGTTGTPLRWGDTRESWAWLASLWGYQYEAAGVTARDTIYMAFSFGHFLGYWTALDAGMQAGALVLTGGGQSSVQRLEAILEHRATILLCNPGYALRLAEIAADRGVRLQESAVRAIICGGEPGASIPATRARIESCWNARCYDRIGATEVGHTGFTCEAGQVHLIESEYLFEVVHPQRLTPVEAGEEGELVATNFGRRAMPVIRYRTGDLVRLGEGPCRCGRSFVHLDGGILGRADDMIVVRGVNLFPSAIENLLLGDPAVLEFQASLARVREMGELRLTVEVDPTRGQPREVAARLADLFHRQLGLRADIHPVSPGTLTRSEGKTRRFTWTEASQQGGSAREVDR